MTLKILLLVLFAVALIGCFSGWFYFIYFISIGYGFAIALLSAAIPIMFRDNLTPVTFLLCLVAFVYGCRLGGFLLYRQLKSSSYRKILYSPSLRQQRPFGTKLILWLSCAALYTCQISPLAFRLKESPSGGEVWAWVGLILMIMGFVLESAADAQKSAAKKVNPSMFVDTGLYRIVRCPNYLGEVILWTGCFLSMIGAGCTPLEWVIALIGYLGILYVMFSGARRLEIRQNSTYGDNPEYQAYVKKTPILLPLIPIYTLERHKWLVG